MTSNELVFWGAAIAAVAAIVVPYVVAFRRRRRNDRARLAEAVQLGVDRAPAQRPFVDVTRCLGCGSCVRACPEADVLGVVAGSATVVNGMRCVGHARCKEACPVGAIDVGLGDLTTRRDVPVLDLWQQSTVAGLFIAGELGGLALVKNATTQARTAVERIAQLAPAARRAGGDLLDLLIVGAGPAGLTAAAAAREHGLAHAVLDQERDLGGTIYHYPRRKLVLLQELELPFLGRLREGEYAKERLLALLKDLCRRAALQVRFGERLAAVERVEHGFLVRSSSGISRARFVLLALGRRGTPRKLDVAGEALPKVMYRLQDAEAFRDQRVLVVGGGDSAAEAAIGLARQPGTRVSLCYRRPKLVRIKKKNEERIAGLLASGRVHGLFSTDVAEIAGASVRLRTPAGIRELPNDYVFVCAGGEPPFELLRAAGVRFGGDPPPAASAPTPRPARIERAAE